MEIESRISAIPAQADLHSSCEPVILQSELKPGGSRSCVYVRRSFNDSMRRTAAIATPAAAATSCYFLRLFLLLLVLLLLWLRLRRRRQALALIGETLENASSKPDRCRLIFSGMPLARNSFIPCAGPGVMNFGHREHHRN